MRMIPPLAIAVMLLVPPLAAAHDPVFSPGPHTLYRNGVEVHLGTHRSEAGGEAEQEYEASLSYGLTGDWVVGVNLPYHVEDGHGERGPITLRSKWRFWRDDRLGAQDAAAVSGRVFLDAGPAGGATDALLGLSYGHEGLIWYRWLSARYRVNGKDDAGFERGDRWFADAVIGVRPRQLRYREPDAVWMLELNLEGTARSERAGASVPDSGGTEAFLSPGLMWTWRNVAVKPGVQLPIYSDLNGRQAATDFRAQIELEFHL